MLFLKCLQSVFLPTVLPNKVFHQCLRLYVNQVLFQLRSEFVYILEELGPHAHNHITNILLPQRKVCARALIRSNCHLCLLPDDIEILERRNVAFVYVLHVLLVNETRKAFEPLLLA